MKKFHFTLGPVQSFVAQSRRTRDLWAGSFLLSWLSGQAMKSVMAQGGHIVFPAVGSFESPEDPMLKAIIKQVGTPSIGSLPNRFKAQVPDNFDPKAVEKAILDKWCDLADAVYKQFILSAPVTTEQTKLIEKRQIKNFWEINWVLGFDPDDEGDSLLDQRKNWRNHWPENEGGDHCTLMGDYQELSGQIRSKSKQGREKSDEFWQALRNETPGNRLDIRDNERLCAIAVIKRLFPRLKAQKLKEIIGWVPGSEDKSLNIAYWPSTTYMAAIPWLEKIANDDTLRSNFKKYADLIETQLSDDTNTYRKLISERHIKMPCLAELGKIKIGAGAYLDDLDGDLLNPYSLTNPRVTYLSDEQPKNFQDDPDEEKRELLINGLKKVNKAVGNSAGSYYALLLLDGDQLGKMLRIKGDSTKISQALLSFTAQVPISVAECDGVTIYAGGDDVLALLPQDKAIACAQKLRDEYEAFFCERGIEEATASCAIIFAHHQLPLQGVLKEAHHQLDDIAKESNGRDALAIAVLKSSGVTAEWVNPWSSVVELQTLICSMQKGNYPRGFFHKLRDRYGFLNQSDAETDGIDLTRLLVAEFLQTREKNISRQDAEQHVGQLLFACKAYVRDEQGKITEENGLRLGGGFIARFLTQENEG